MDYSDDTENGRCKIKHAVTNINNLSCRKKSNKKAYGWG